MNKKTIITVLLALIATTGQAQVKCHVEGTLETDARIPNFNYELQRLLERLK